MIKSALLAVASVLVSSSAFASQYIVKYKTATDDVKYGIKLQVIEDYKPGKLTLVEIDDKNLVKLRKNPNLEYMVLNSKLYALDAPSESSTVEQWALKTIKAEAAWALVGKGSASVKVAVIDTGADYNHLDLKTNMLPGYNFIENNNDPMDQVGNQPGHGTHCSGIIGGTGAPDASTLGASPVVSIMPLRFLDSGGSGNLLDAVKAIDFAVAQKVQIISASWGAMNSRENERPLLEAMKRADDAGIIFVAAAANSASNNDTSDVFPANAGFPNTITVAASDVHDKKPSWSNYGTANVHLAAPGVNIISTLPGDKYGLLSGTSMSTPLVSGLVALMLAQDPTLTGVEVRALLQKTGAKVDIQTACNCRIDAEAAVKAVVSKAKYIVPQAASLKVGESLAFKLKNAKGGAVLSVSDPSIASIDATGLLTGLRGGTVTIKAVDESGKAEESLAVHVIGSDELQ